MGADLYIESISEREKNKWKGLFDSSVDLRNKASSDYEKEGYQKQVNKYYDLMYAEDGYFRDSYNSTNLLYQLGLSWWDDVIPQLDKNSYLSTEGAEWFLKEIQSRTVGKIDIPKACITKENPEEKWEQYFISKHEELEGFLKRAIGLKEKILCSL